MKKIKELWDKIPANIKRWIISSIDTFLTGFVVTLAGAMKEFTVEGITWSIIGGILFMAVRGGFKALREIWIVKK